MKVKIAEFGEITSCEEEQAAVKKWLEDNYGEGYAVDNGEVWCIRDGWYLVAPDPPRKVG